MNFLRKHLPSFILSILIFFSVFLLLRSDFFVTLTDKLNFTLFHWSKESPSDEIIIVAFDDKTLNSSEFQRFQDFSRADYAKLIDIIFTQQPKAIGVDVFFFNASKNPEDDTALARVISEHPNIILGNEFDFTKQQFLFPSESINVPLSQQGSINLLTKTRDKQSVIAHVPLIIDKNNIQKAQFEPFSLRLWRALFPQEKLKTTYFSHEYHITSQAQKLNIPLQNDLVNINYFGQSEAYQRISLKDVFEGNIPSDIFHNKIVLIGATAHDLHDAFLTPRESAQMMPGVEIHAHALQTLLEQKFIFYQTQAEKILTLGVVLGVSLITFLFLSFWWASLMTFILGIGIYLGAVLLFQKGTIIDFTTPIAAVVIFWALNYTFRFLRAEKQKRRIRETFSRYVSKDVVAHILKNSEKIDLGGESREITVFFSDLIGFTSLSEKLSARESMELLNEYLDTMSSIILGKKGTIDKYMGDAIMAFWGAPLLNVDHALLACQSALEQKKALPKMNEKLKEKGFPELRMRIGIHSGIANVGNIGTGKRLEYTAIGDTVNLGSRLEGINTAYGSNIIISESTKNLTGDNFFTRELDMIRVKGKLTPVRIFELIAKKGEEGEEYQRIQKIYEEGFQFYRQQDWENSVQKFSSLDDAPARIMLERIAILRNQKLDKQWDGVFAFSTK